MAFVLHEKLAADCERIGDFELCTLLLMRDDRFPWTILVPRLAGLRDFTICHGRRPRRCSTRSRWCRGC